MSNTVSFEAWVEAVLDHDPSEPEWYWADDFGAQWERLGLTDDVTVSYLRRLLLKPECLRPYSLAQIAQGIWFLIGESSPAQSSASLLNGAVQLESRVACIGAMAHFFRTFVGPASLGPADTESDPFHIACYMWWDILPLRGWIGGGESELHQACMSALEQILELPSEVCRLSALHGLHHWRPRFEKRVDEVVASFLCEGRDLSPRIREYAAAL